MKIPAAVHWHEGMLLAPQHFQQSAQRSEALLHYHASVVSPFHWGVVEMDGRKLADGKLSIASVEAILPDGLVVSHPPRDGSSAPDLSIDLGEHRAELAGGQTVWLTVAARQPGERFHERYDYATDQVVDEDTGRDDVPLQRLRPRLKLHLGRTLEESSVGIPVAKVVVRGQAIEMIEYEPPWLVVRAGSKIHTVCRGVAELLREKANGLATSVANESKSMHGPQLLESHMLVHSLVAALPALEVLLDSGAAHPFALYLALASVAGALAPGHVPERVAAYDHDDLLRVFVHLGASIEETIRTAIRAPYTLRPFTLENEAFRVTIDPAWLTRPMFLGVRAAAGFKAAELDQWVMHSAIGGASRIGQLLHDRSIGVKREAARDDDLLPAAGVAFYKLLPPYGPLEELVIANLDQKSRPAAEVVLYVNCEVSP